MHSTFLRKEHIHGVLLGVAIADALSQPRQQIPPRELLRRYGRRLRANQHLPGGRYYGANTQLMLLCAQALLNSRSDLRHFRVCFQRRLRYIPLSMAVGLDKATRRAATLSWIRPLVSTTGSHHPGSGAATRAIFSALAIQGTGHRLSKWTEESTSLTHTHPAAIDGCRVLATLANRAAVTRPEALQIDQAMEEAISVSEYGELKKRLSALSQFLSERRTPRAVAKHFGWQRGISRHIVPTTVLAAYCWLRYPFDYRRAVEAAIMLGGDGTVVAVTGGLAGAHLGYSGLPADWADRLSDFPHGRHWLEALAERFSHWPHGFEDLHDAPAQPSEPIMQIVRNGGLLPIRLTRRWLRPGESEWSENNNHV